MRFKPFTFSSLLLYCLGLSSGHSQSTERVWSVVTLNKIIGKWTYQIEPQLRVHDRTYLYDRFLTNGGVGYQFSTQSSFWLGATAENIGRQASSPGNHQYRLWQQLINNSRPDVFNFSLRSRFEQRKLLSSPTLNYRLRERLTITTNLTQSLALVGYDELFFNINQPDWVAPTTFSQNRISIGLNQQATKQLIMGAGYIFQALFPSPTRYGNVFTLNIQYSC